MIKPLLTRVGVAVGSLALSLTAGVGVASADPDVGSAVDSTCTYSQFVAALNAQNPSMPGHSTYRRTCRHGCSSSSPRRGINASSGPRRW